MDREELLQLLRLGPIRLTMNSGDTVDIPNRETAVISSMSANVLVKSADDGKWRTHIYPLVTISKAESLSPAN